jgi:hypothetical protein
MQPEVGSSFWQAFYSPELLQSFRRIAQRIAAKYLRKYRKWFGASWVSGQSQTLLLEIHQQRHRIGAEHHFSPTIAQAWEFLCLGWQPFSGDC